MTTLITSNGGRVAGLDEPKLTHIIVDKRDASRRQELMKRTSKYVAETQPSHDPHLIFTCAVRPKRRHLVISEFITACLEESTLLDEDGKFPKKPPTRAYFRADGHSKNLYPDTCDTCEEDWCSC